MKKINILKMISYVTLTVYTGQVSAANALSTFDEIVEFPLVHQRVQLQAQASVVLPALVGEQRFKSNLAEDCKKFEESYDQYAVHVDEVSRDLANTVRELALGYTMKPEYELYLSVDLGNSSKLIEPTQWSLVPDRATVQFADNSMMSISKKIGLDQKNAEVDTQAGGQFVLRGRDLACDILSGRAHLRSTINLDVQADIGATAQARQVAQAWLDRVHVIEQMDLSDRQKAAWLGFQFESLKKSVEAENLSEYLNVHYFFEIFFQPNQIILQPQWQSDFSQNWHKKIQVTLPVKVEQL